MGRVFATANKLLPDICRVFTPPVVTTSDKNLPKVWNGLYNVVSLQQKRITNFFLVYCGDLVDEILKGKWAPREDTVGGEIW